LKTVLSSPSHVHHAVGGGRRLLPEEIVVGALPNERLRAILSIVMLRSLGCLASLPLFLAAKRNQGLSWAGLPTSKAHFCLSPCTQIDTHQCYRWTVFYRVLGKTRNLGVVDDLAAPSRISWWDRCRPQQVAKRDTEPPLPET